MTLIEAILTRGLSKEAITMKQLAEATKRGLGDRVHIKRDITRISPALRAATGVKEGKFGPATLARYHKGKSVVATGDGQDLLHINDQLKNGIKRGDMKKEDLLNTSPNAKHGLNRLMQHHELNEAKSFDDLKKAQTLAGQQAGHHSYTNVLAHESNVVGAAEGKLKEGAGALRKLRETTGETTTLNSLLPVDKHGTTGGYKYGGPKKINRSMRKAMYRKELNTPPPALRPRDTTEIKKRDSLSESLRGFKKHKPKEVAPRKSRAERRKERTEKKTLNDFPL